MLVSVRLAWVGNDFRGRFLVESVPGRAFLQIVRSGGSGRRGSAVQHFG